MNVIDLYFLHINSIVSSMDKQQSRLDKVLGENIIPGKVVKVLKYKLSEGFEVHHA